MCWDSFIVSFDKEGGKKPPTSVGVVMRGTSRPARLMMTHFHHSLISLPRDLGMLSATLGKINWETVLPPPQLTCCHSVGTAVLEDTMEHFAFQPLAVST